MVPFNLTWPGRSGCHYLLPSSGFTQLPATHCSKPRFRLLVVYGCSWLYLHKYGLVRTDFFTLCLLLEIQPFPAPSVPLPSLTLLLGAWCFTSLAAFLFVVVQALHSWLFCPVSSYIWTQSLNWLTSCWCKLLSQGSMTLVLAEAALAGLW